MYNTVSELITISEERGVQPWEIIIENEIELTGKPREKIFEKLDARYEVMYNSAHGALEHPLNTVGKLISGIASTQNEYAKSTNGLCGGFINRVMALALSSSEVNASMGKICAAPTAGSCGILPAVLVGMHEEFNLPRDTVIKGLITASGIGAVVVKNATVAGAEGGCQAECGVAAAMAAAAAVQMFGGTARQIADACSIVLMNAMGLACDPIAGLVQVPCAQRNASQAVNALLSADLALGGMKSIIPVDEVIEAMYSVGKMMPPAIKETALGGVAATPTGRRIFKEIFGEKSE